MNDVLIRLDCLHEDHHGIFGFLFSILILSTSAKEMDGPLLMYQEGCFGSGY